MSLSDPAVVALLVFGVAVLYSSVGHGGASGYLAVLALAGYSAAAVSTTALILNVGVSAIAFLAYRSVSPPRRAVVVPLLVGSLPMAFLGGKMPVSERLFTVLLCLALAAAALRLLFSPRGADQAGNQSPIWLFAIGAAVGLVSGMIGVGGGIFLSPILLLARWATLKETAAISALFILLNSLSGLVARGPAIGPALEAAGPFLAVAMAGGVLGSYLASRRLPLGALRSALGVVLLLAAFKLATKA